MKLNPGKVLAEIKAAGIDFLASLPESLLTETAMLAERDPDITHVSVSSEDEGVAICAGAWLVGRRPAMLMEDTGLLVSCFALHAVCNDRGIPVLLMVGYRGDMRDPRNYSHFAGYGLVIEPLLRTLNIPYRVLYHEDEVGEAIRLAKINMDGLHRPVALLFSGGFLA